MDWYTYEKEGAIEAAWTEMEYEVNALKTYLKNKDLAMIRMTLEAIKANIEAIEAAIEES